MQVNTLNQMIIDNQTAGVKILGMIWSLVNPDWLAQNGQRYKKQERLVFENLVDTTRNMSVMRSLGDSYKMEAGPHVVLIDKNGVVVFSESATEAHPFFTAEDLHTLFRRFLK